MSNDKRRGRQVIRKRKHVESGKISELNNAFNFVIRLKQSENMKPRTISDYRNQLRYFSDWLRSFHPKIYNVNDITVDILREYILWCRNDKVRNEGHPFKPKKDKDKRGLSPATVNIRIRLLKAVFRTLHKEGVISSNPAKNLTLMKTEKDTVQPLTDEEVKRLLAQQDQEYYSHFRNYVAIILILDTGIRLNELCALRIENVHIEIRQITLPAKFTKNRTSRVLPLSKKTASLLYRLITEVRDYFGDVEYVFCTSFGDPLNAKTLQKSLLDYGKMARIDKQVSPHVLRHTFARNATLNGMDVFTLQRILGHADITTTRRYVQMSDDDIVNQHGKHSPISFL